MIDVMVSFQNSVLWSKVRILVYIEMKVVCLVRDWVRDSGSYHLHIFDFLGKKCLHFSDILEIY